MSSKRPSWDVTASLWVTIDNPDEPSAPGRCQMTLCWSANQPAEVTLLFGSEPWVVARDVLDAGTWDLGPGTAVSAGLMDVRVRTTGAEFELELEGPPGPQGDTHAVVRGQVDPVRRFLTRTYKLVSGATEEVWPGLDAELEQLLKEAS